MTPTNDVASRIEDQGRRDVGSPARVAPPPAVDDDDDDEGLAEA